MNYRRRCTAINRSEKDFLYSEQNKLKKKLTSLENNYEAKMKVFKDYDEDKKILRLKKEFTLRRETNVEEQKIIRDQINKIIKEEELDRHTRHLKDWERIKEKIKHFKPYRDFLKAGIEIINENQKDQMLKWVGIPFSEFKHFIIETSEYDERLFNKTFQLMIDDYDIHSCFSYSRYDNKIRISFIDEIAKLEV